MSFSNLVLLTWSNSKSTSFLIDFIAYNFLLSFNSAKYTLPKVPLPKIKLKLDILIPKTVISLKSSSLTFVFYLEATNIDILIY